MSDTDSSDGEADSDVAVDWLTIICKGGGGGGAAGDANGGEEGDAGAGGATKQQQQQQQDVEEEKEKEEFFCDACAARSVEGADVRPIRGNRYTQHGADYDMCASLPLLLAPCLCRVRACAL
jgi:hypothetical protein